VQKLVLLAFAGVCAFATPTTPCPTATVEYYLANFHTKDTACYEGALPDDFVTIHVKHWSSSTGQAPGGGEYREVLPSEVLLTPSNTPGLFGLSFTSDAFSVTGFDRILALFDYTIDPRPPILSGTTLSMQTSTPVFPGTATITANLCLGQEFGPGCENQRTLEVFHFGNTADLVDSVTFSPVQLVDLRITIDLRANGASSSIRGGTSGVTTGAVVPEPGSVGFVMGGLGALLAIRRRRPRNS